MYDYKDSKKRIDDILDSKTKIEEKDTIPSSDDEFTYSNGIKSWVGAIFVDMVGSSEMCKSPDENTARIFRAYCSEIIAIMKDDDNYRQIGIRGDCVYSINSTPNKQDLVTIFRTAYQINTFMKMLNKRLKDKGYDTIRAGIGLGCSEDLIIKAGQAGSGINDKIWIGKAVVNASHLGDTANRNGIDEIVMDPCFYNNIHKILEKEDPQYKNWITPHKSYGLIDFYQCNIVQTDFNNWIENDFKD